MKRIAVIVVMIAAFAAPVAAQAETNGYGDVAGVTQSSGGPTDTGANSSAPVGSVGTAGEEVSGGVLPFTGLQLALIFGAGVLLLGTGLALRRARVE